MQIQKKQSINHYHVIGHKLSRSDCGARSTTINFLSTETDFGTILQGQPQIVAFAFTNTGKVPLVIYSAEASCGCTQPEYSKEPISPGEKGEIKVTYDAKEPGRFAKNSDRVPQSWRTFAMCAPLSQPS